MRQWCVDVSATHESNTSQAALGSSISSEAAHRYVYERRRPELSTLHQVVRENLQTLYAAVEEGFVGAALPDFVRRELESYLDCGLLCRGFAMLACEDCDERRLVAFSCKGRSFCPSCLGRRMAQTGANLLDHVIPRVPLRQLVLTVPFELRTRLAYDGELLGAVSRIFVDSVLGFYRRRMRDLGYGLGKSGAVTVVQRTNADLRLNPHLHSIALDGVYVADEEGTPVFHPLPGLDSMDVAELLQVVRVRLLRFLERCGVIEETSGLTVLPDDLADREPALAQLAAASVSGLAPAGPERRDRPPRPITLRGGPGVEMTAPLAAAELGFSLHAATTANADDECGREALVRYVLRPPIAQERLKLLPDGLVRIELRRPFGDGTVAVDMDPLSLLCRLAAAVPPPHFNTVRYGGVLAPAAKWRALVVPPPPPPAEDESTTEQNVALPAEAPSQPQPDKPDKPSTHRSGWRLRAELMRRCFQLEVDKCTACGGRMKLRALVTKPASVRRLLRHLGEPTEAPPLAPARDPPFYRSPVLRRRTHQPSPPRQVEMFGLGP